MIEVEGFYVGSDERIYYKLSGDETWYDLLDNMALKCRVCETIKKYHEEKRLLDAKPGS